MCLKEGANDRYTTSAISNDIVCNVSYIRVAGINSKIGGINYFIAKYISIGGIENFIKLKEELIKECNDLQIPGMPKVTDLVPLDGAFVNVEYPLANGNTVKFLDDNDIYLGTQLECEFNNGEIIRCFGIAANMDFIINYLPTYYIIKLDKFIFI